MFKKKGQKFFYSHSEVLGECLKYFDGDELAATTWINKYASRNENNELIEKSPDEMHKRMAKEFGRIELRYKSKKFNKKNLSAYGQKRSFLSVQK